MFFIVAVFVVRVCDGSGLCFSTSSSHVAFTHSSASVGLRIRGLMTLLLLACGWGSAAAVNVTDLFGASGRTWQLRCNPSNACRSASGKVVITFINNETGAFRSHGCVARMHFTGRWVGMRSSY
jgi:hypothetical protein